MLQLASDYVDAFDKLIAAYHQISMFLPRFDLLSTAFKDHGAFQQILGLVYVDILDFHACAYKFFRKRGMEKAENKFT
jgi:hypothetical protein